MPLPAIFCLCLSTLAHVADAPLPQVSIGSFGIPDTLFLVVLALIVFGPKKLPEISRQIGKLLYEFRKASNDFKFQIEEELRSAEQAERQKELAAQAAVPQAATPVAITAGETVSAEPIPASEDTPAEAGLAETPDPALSTTPTILPPASGVPVSTRSPYRAVENSEGAAEVTAAGHSLDDDPQALNDPRALDELEADAQDAVRAAAADPSYKRPEAYNQPEAYTQPGDAVPTHHG
ncbi:MAG TPA: twin-arginine translocase TatA/TatE family subunit [Acidobacteriaceae bacterium]|nr:twin-arginine translocase TatA/TatE family subunit [Acidobacteriaceae bacterium]